jgi:hypothetical protein
MKTMMVRYKVKPARAAENERLIAKVFTALNEKKPAGLSYASFKLRDGVSFVHLASIERPAEDNPLTDLPAFKNFIADAKSRCVELPESFEVQLIGEYNFLSGGNSAVIAKAKRTHL